MEAEGVHRDGLICSVNPHSQSIILALVLFSIGILHTRLLCLQPQRATPLGLDNQSELDI